MTAPWMVRLLFPAWTAQFSRLPLIPPTPFTPARCSSGRLAHINGTTRTRIARLNADGSLDISFNPAPERRYRARPGHSTGWPCVAGWSLHQCQWCGLNHIARLNADGSVDSSFTTGVGVGADDTVNAITLQPDNRIVLGGRLLMPTRDPQPHYRLMPDGTWTRPLFRCRCG